MPTSTVRSQLGSVLIEYVLVIGLFSLPIAAAALSLGGPLLQFFRHLQLLWAGPFP